MTTIATCLWFDDNGHEAARYYTDLIDGATLGREVVGPADTPNVAAGIPVTTEVTLKGQRFTFLNGGPNFSKSEYASIVLECDSQEETDRYRDALLADGGKPGDCGWLTDKYGVSWQLVPAGFMDLLADPAVSAQAFASMMTMQRLDLAQLREACGR